MSSLITWMSVTGKRWGRRSYSSSRWLNGLWMAPQSYQTLFFTSSDTHHQSLSSVHSWLNIFLRRSRRPPNRQCNNIQSVSRNSLWSLVPRSWQRASWIRALPRMIARICARSERLWASDVGKWNCEREMPASLRNAMLSGTVFDDVWETWKADACGYYRYRNPIEEPFEV